MEESNTFLTELSSDRRKIGYKLKKLPPIKSSSEIDYANLELLSKSMEDGKSREENHKLFMENYKKIFKSKTDLLSIEDGKSGVAERSVKTLRVPKKLPENNESHNISQHLSKIRKQTGSPTKEAVSDERLKIIRRIGRKLPFDRSIKENQQLMQSLSYIECFSNIPKRILGRLVATAQLEKWEPQYTVFGDSGLYLIIKGRASPQSNISYIDKDVLRREESGMSFASAPDSCLQSLFKLTVGDYFGTLEKLQDTDRSSRYLSVMTCEECELLRFSNTSFERVVKQVKEEEDTEKLHLAQSCKIFKDWPVLSLKKVSETFKWFKIPAGETLLMEGGISNSISFIKSGRCQLKKTLTVAFTYPDGRKVKKRKELVTGALQAGDSFGEWSFISGLPAEQSVLSESPIIIASLNHEAIQGLDDVTRALFRQTCEATDSGASEEIIKKQYIEKQAELDWKTTKDGIINETLHYRGILPGYSKWSRNPSANDIEHFSDAGM